MKRKIEVLGIAAATIFLFVEGGYAAGLDTALSHTQSHKTTEIKILPHDRQLINRTDQPGKQVTPRVPIVKLPVKPLPPVSPPTEEPTVVRINKPKPEPLPISPPPMERLRVELPPTPEPPVPASVDGEDTHTPLGPPVLAHDEDSHEPTGPPVRAKSDDDTKVTGLENAMEHSHKNDGKILGNGGTLVARDGKPGMQVNRAPGDVVHQEKPKTMEHSFEPPVEDHINRYLGAR